MADAPNPVYAFGSFLVDPQEGVLTRDGAAIPLTPKAFDMLVVLVRHSGHIVDKEELLKEVWPDTFVEEGNLTVHISALRRALGDATGGAEFAGLKSGATSIIETVPRRGYRFCVPVQEIWKERPTLLLERRVETRIVREEIEESLPSLPWSRRHLMIAGVSLLLLSVMAFGWRAVHKTAASSRPMRLVPFASYPGGVQMPAFAPDGERIAFQWAGPTGEKQDIYVKVIGNDPPLQLTTGPGWDRFPAWSPDGRQIAFVREEGVKVGVFVVGALGGAERKLTDLSYSRYFDLKWSSDGRYLAFAEKTIADKTNSRESYNSYKSRSIFLLSLASLEKRQLTFPQDADFDLSCDFSPDGQTLAFVRHDDHSAGIWRVPVGGGNPTKIHQEFNWIGHLAWTPDGQALVFTSGREGGNKLFRVAATGGAPEPLPFTDDSAYFPTIAPRGNRMAYVREYGDADLWRVELDSSHGPGRMPRVLLGTARAETAPEFSPDGRRIAFLSDGTGRREVWVSQADGTSPRPLTDFNAWSTHAPTWSPDGRELAFASVYGPAESTDGVFVLNVETKKVRRLTDDAHALPTWSRNGRWIYLAFSPFREARGIWKVSAEGGKLIAVVQDDGMFVQESFDGHDLYYSKVSGGIWKTPSAGGQETEVIRGFGLELRGNWRAVEDGIYYLNKNSKAEPAIEFFEFATRRSYRIAPLTGTYTMFGGGLTVSPDRRSIVYSQTSRTASEIMLVENFR